MFRPHLNAPYFPLVRTKNITANARQLPWPVYALDDNCALQVVDGVVTPVGTGEWLHVAPDGKLAGM